MSQRATKDVPTTLLGRPSNNLKLGIVGLPNVGKSTFFNVLTKSSVAAENYPFSVPDVRFDWLCTTYKPTSKVPAYLTVIDIAGLVRGASNGEGLGNAFLSHIKAVDGIFHMVRTFTDESIEHVEGDVDPIRDMEIIHEELRLKDVEFLTKQLEIAKKNLRGHEQDKIKVLEYDTIAKALEAVTSKKDIREIAWNNKELLTAKPVVYLANMAPDEFIKRKNKWLPKMKEWIDAKGMGDILIPFSAAFEASIEKQSEDVKSALPKIIVTGYQALQLQYYFTAGKDEVRAWTIRKGVKAPQAAGVIHTDFERGFIAAEVMSFDDLKNLGTEAAVKAAGKHMTKGKDYVVNDGDVIFFKFNVTGKKK